MNTAVATKSDLHLIATNPAEMVTAQAGMIEWCKGKLAGLLEERAEAVANRDLAKKSKWRVAPWQNRVFAIQRKVTFFTKVKKALEAGYYIVPPMPTQAFAIRTDRAVPKGSSKWADSDLTQSAKKLPAGEGRYRNPTPEVYGYSGSYVKDDKVVEWERYDAEEWRDIDFPFKLVKPQILEATDRAMALKIFDQLGVLPGFQTGGDPVVFGQILHPVASKPPLTFFVAWWLNTEDL